MCKEKSQEKSQEKSREKSREKSGSVGMIFVEISN